MLEKITRPKLAEMFGPGYHSVKTGICIRVELEVAVETPKNAIVRIGLDVITGVSILRLLGSNKVQHISK